jgi:hypothetical protein
MFNPVKWRQIVNHQATICLDLAPMSQRSKNPPVRHSPMRRNIASLAARLMAEDGIDDYGQAKRKAARQLGAPETEALPNNAEVEAELRTYQSLYQGQEQRERLHRLRTVAVAVMRLLNPFSPYLTGSVLDGTAGRFARVELVVFPDSAKTIEMFLLDRRIDYRHGDVRRGSGEPPEVVFNFDWQDSPVSVAVYPTLAERAQHRNPHTGRVIERAPLSAVEALLKEET